MFLKLEGVTVRYGHGSAARTAVDAATLGLLAGQCQVPDDFDQLAAAEIADLFEGA